MPRRTIDLPLYAARRVTALEAVEARPRGTRTKIAFDTRVAPTLISSVLNGGVVNARILSLIEAWLDANPLPEPQPAASPAEGVEVPPAAPPPPPPPFVSPYPRPRPAPEPTGPTADTWAPAGPHLSGTPR